MSTDTVPAAVPEPPVPPHGPATPAAIGGAPAKGFLASMVAAVEPARSTFDLTPTTPTDGQAGDGDGVLDRSAPGVSSASFRDAEAAAGNDPSGEKRKAQASIWKAWWLAGAQRWAKGGGTANKRLDLKKARAQAHQVKENRTSTVMKSGGIPVRNSVGAGGGSKGSAGKSGGNTGGKGPVNSMGNGSGGAPRGGSGGARGAGGRSGSTSASDAGNGRQPAGRGNDAPWKGSGPGGKGSAGATGSSSSGTPHPSGKKADGGHDSKHPKTSSGKGPRKHSGSGGSSGSGSGGGKQGVSGKDGRAGKNGSAGGTGKASGPAGGKHSKAGDKNSANQKDSHNQPQPDTRTPLHKSRDIGHKDGSTVRNMVDHVKAYKDGVADGYRDKRDENAKEHDRLDKAHDQHKTSTKDDTTAKPASGGPLKATVHGQQVTITDDNAPMEDPFMSKPTPIQAQGIDAKTITLGDGFLKGSVTRGELRTFKQYEGRLEARIGGLAKVADATKALAGQARDQATACQQLADQAKAVKGGEKLVGTLTKLSDQAKAQADEADEVHKQAAKAHDFAKAVLSNIQTRYTPLYQAVVDSDETKPAELTFYADRGITRSDTRLAA